MNAAVKTKLGGGWRFITAIVASVLMVPAMALVLTSAAYAEEAAGQASAQAAALGSVPDQEQKVITGIRPVVTADNLTTFYPIVGQTVNDLAPTWSDFTVYTDSQRGGAGVEGVLELVPDTSRILDWTVDGRDTQLKFAKDALLWPLKNGWYDSDEFRITRACRLKIKDAYKDQYKFVVGQSVQSLTKSPHRIFDGREYDANNIQSWVVSETEIDFVITPVFARKYQFTGDDGVESISLPTVYMHFVGNGLQKRWSYAEEAFDRVAAEKAGETYTNQKFYSIKDGFLFAGIYDKQGERVDKLDKYDAMMARLDANDKVGSAVGSYTIKTAPMVIPYEPTDMNNPADPGDPNIAETLLKVNKTHPVTRGDYVVVGFKTAANGSFGQNKTGVSFLVRKDAPFKQITLPTPAANDGFEFDAWAPALPSGDTKVTADALYTASFKKLPAKYTVSFEVNGGSPILAQTVEEGAKAQEPAAPTKDDHTFAGWFADAAFEHTFDFTAPITADTTVYAKWDKVPAPALKTYTVTFEVNGGTAVEAQTVEEGKLAQEPAAPTKADHTFAGWFKDAELKTPFDFKAPITADTTIYAKWEKVPSKTDPKTTKTKSKSKRRLAQTGDQSLALVGGIASVSALVLGAAAVLRRKKGHLS
ncbi:InlB B-repeat-containing protein [Collinsella sp. AGMB00827]|uniref:InlB B-repeat-containing protein n=1 Tax=Collinsella ureilytica TaxID=2869515 RepID=A0ABS7MJJ1_9ACTN|nr:InlB B-repeat-containing protein [Collinsella urealyticum]MBY4797534.1 InlB B-repeat-containing protein [Collinsella urealyticum]